MLLVKNHDDLFQFVSSYVQNSDGLFVSENTTSTDLHVAKNEDFRSVTSETYANYRTTQQY